MKISYDQTTDFSNKELYSYLKDTELPTYVKEAEEDHADDVRKLNKAAFADPNRRVFPINTPARVFVSNAFFINKKAAIEKQIGKLSTDAIETRIKQAAEILEITDDLDNYNRNLNVKEASDYSEGYVSVVDVDGQSLELFPYKTAADVQHAANQFVTEINKLPFQWREKIANDFVKVAKEQGIDELPDLLCKYAGMFFATPDTIRRELWRRSTKVANETHKQHYIKLAECTEGLDEVGDIRKIAESCYYMEKTAGLYNNKNTREILGDPIDRFFNLSIDKVAEMLDVVKCGNAIYKIADLQSISAGTYKEAFDIDIDPADKEKLAEVLPTMPLSDVALFAELSGIKSL